jgi:phosphate butyryltransferase
MDRTALAATVQAASAGILAPILVGPAEAIQATARTAGLDISAWPIVDAVSDVAASAAAASLVADGSAQVVMKGSLHTSTLLHAVLDRDSAIAGHSWLSHVFVFDIPAYPKPLLLSDAVVAIAPTLQQKAIICRNAITVAHVIGIPEPRVAILSAVEDIDPAIASTLDAAVLCKMADRGQITGAVLDGPLALDNAVSAAAAATKGIASPVAGDADVLIVPNLEAGNILYKSLTYLAGADAAGVIVGAAVPIVLVSRADSVRTRIASAALASVVASASR